MFNNTFINKFIINDGANHVYVVATVYWWINFTLAPKFEANVYFSPKLQTWRLMCTLSLNLEAEVNLYM